MREGGGAEGAGGVREVGRRAGVLEQMLFELQLLSKWGYRAFVFR